MPFAGPPRLLTMLQMLASPTHALSAVCETAFLPLHSQDRREGGL